MQETQFYEWLIKRMDINAAKSRRSNCRRVEAYEGNLDDHYSHDKGVSLISRLTYTAEDLRRNRHPKHRIPIKGNLCTGSATLKQASNLYIEFKNATASIRVDTGEEIILETSMNNQATKRKVKDETTSMNQRNLNIQTYTPANKIKDHEKDICSILAILCHHIHPEIIKQIQEANKNEYSYFEELFRDLIEIENFLFPGSACVFPGIRRYISGKGKKIQYNHEYKAIIDDNTFPRHLWCFLVNNRTYNGPNWRESGLNQFELAHIFTHKTTELDFEKQFFKSYNDQIHPHGEFTCGCNIVLLPKGTFRPTDNSETIKAVFYQRYIELYGEEPLNGRRGFITSKVPSWYQEIQWNEPFCPPDWSEKVDNLIKYRTSRITQLIKNIK